MLWHDEEGTIPIIGRTKQHLYILPHVLLRHIIAHYTVLLPFESDEKLLLIPDASGCMILTKSEEGMAQAGFWGPTTQVVEVQGQKVHHGFQFFVEFLPGGAYTLLGIDQKQVVDLQIELSEVTKQLSSALTRDLEQVKYLSEWIRSVDHLFINELMETDAKEQFNRSAWFISNHIAKVSVSKLSQEMCYSSRQLSRICNETIGMSIKTYQQIVRINQAIKMMKRSQMDLTQIAQYLGYYDQAHFIHDFKAICHMSPTGYLKSMSVFYNEPYKL